MTQPVDKRAALEQAFAQAIKGDRKPLLYQMARLSGLPGVRHSETWAEIFVEIALSHGRKAEPLLRELALLSADEAQGDTEFEFVPLCAVEAIGARAIAEDHNWKKHMAFLHDRADDLRFRVRDAVVRSVTKIGAARGDTVVHELAGWTIEHYFQSAAALFALSHPTFYRILHDPDQAIARCNEAFEIVKNAPRSAVRYPGYKALIDAISACPAALSSSFLEPTSAMLETWAQSGDNPELRAIVETNLSKMTHTKQHGEHITRIRHMLAQSTPPPRDPGKFRGGTRNRGKR